MDLGRRFDGGIIHEVNKEAEAKTTPRSWLTMGSHVDFAGV